MITNGYAIIYLILSFLSLVIGVGGAIVGFMVAWKWKSTLSSEERYELEKRTHLAITLISLTLYGRFFMIPFWFWTMKSFIPMIPGAMCLTGVHMVDPPFSVFATGFKFIIPMLYGLWLAMHLLDQKIETQPLLIAKLRLLAPIGLFLVLESFFDMHTLLALRPVPVSCCTSVFDIPREGVTGVVLSNIWGWVIAFYAFTLLLLLSLFSLRKQKPFRRLPQMLSLLALISIVVFLLALHTKVSPLMLNTPFHHCVFCLWERFPSVALSSTFVVLGLWLIIIYGLFEKKRRIITKTEIFNTYIKGIINWAFYLLLIGVVFLSARMLLTMR